MDITGSRPLPSVRCRYEWEGHSSKERANRGLAFAPPDTLTPLAVICTNLCTLPKTTTPSATLDRLPGGFANLYGEKFCFYQFKNKLLGQGLGGKTSRKKRSDLTKIMWQVDNKPGTSPLTSCCSSVLSLLNPIVQGGHGSITSGTRVKTKLEWGFPLCAVTCNF